MQSKMINAEALSTNGYAYARTERLTYNTLGVLATTGTNITTLSKCYIQPLGTVRPLYRTGVSTLQRTLFIYLINKYISLSDI